MPLRKKELTSGILRQEVASLIEFSTDQGKRLNAMSPEKSGRGSQSGPAPPESPLDLQQRPEPPCLDAADRDFGLLLVVHLELKARLKPRNYLSYLVDVYEKRAMYPPKYFGIQVGLQFLDGPVIRLTFELRGHDRDQAIIDGGLDHVLRIDYQVPVISFDQKFGALNRGLRDMLWRLI
jgi:hypothetical protein